MNMKDNRSSDRRSSQAKDSNTSIRSASKRGSNLMRSRTAGYSINTIKRTLQAADGDKRHESEANQTIRSSSKAGSDQAQQLRQSSNKSSGSQGADKRSNKKVSKDYNSRTFNKMLETIQNQQAAIVI